MIISYLTNTTLEKVIDSIKILIYSNTYYRLGRLPHHIFITSNRKSKIIKEKSEIES